MTHNKPHVIDALTLIGSTSNGMSCRSGTDSRLSHVDPTPTSDPEIVVWFRFFILFLLPLCSGCRRVVSLFLFYGRPVMWVSVRVGHFDRSVVRPMGLFYPVPGLVFTGPGFPFLILC